MERSGGATSYWLGAACYYGAIVRRIFAGCAVRVDQLGTIGRLLAPFYLAAKGEAAWLHVYKQIMLRP